MDEHGNIPGALAPLMRAAREAAESEPHPSPQTLEAYLAAGLDDSAADHVRGHLVFCDDCAAVIDAAADAVDATRVPASASSRASGAVEWLVERFVQLAPVPAGPIALAAAPSSTAAPFESFEAEDLRLVLVLTTDGEVVATLTRAGEPAGRVPVTLLRMAIVGEPLLIAHGTTDSAGRASFGPLASLPLPGLGQWHEIHVPQVRGPGA